MFKTGNRMARLNQDITGEQHMMKNDDGVLAVSDDKKNSFGKVIMRGF